MFLLNEIHCYNQPETAGDEDESADCPFTKAHASSSEANFL